MDELEQLAQAADRAMKAAEELPDDARTTALGLRDAIEAFHRAGLTHIVRRLRQDDRGRELLYELVDHPAVFALFRMHGLVKTEAPAPAPTAAATGFVPLGAITGTPRAEPGWSVGPAESTIQEGRPERWDVEDGSVLLTRHHGRLHVYRNECAHLGLTLDGGRFESETGILTCPWHGFRFDCATGECITSPAAQLEQLPFRVEQGRIVVRRAR